MTPSLLARLLRPSLALLAALPLAACGSESASDPAEDAGSIDAPTEAAADSATAPDGASPACSSSPPEAPDGLVCQQWSCAAAPAPECWDCATVADEDGTPCTLSDPEGGSGECSSGACVGAKEPADPGGPAGTSKSVEIQLQGGSGTVKLPLTIYLPETSAKSPVVVLDHGFQLGAELYASYGQHLASWGYVAIVPQMPGGLIGGPSHLDLSDYLLGVLDWIDADSVSSTGALEGKSDPKRLGLAGHSMGGKISLLTATRDARSKAVFAIDPVDAAGGPIPGSEQEYPSVTPELMGSIKIPTVFLGETTNATCTGFMCQACAPQDDNFHQYFVHATNPALQIEVLGANHMSFLDNPNCGLTCSVCPKGTDDPAKTRWLTRRYMTSFFNAVLRDQAGYREYLVGAKMAADVAGGLVKSEAKGSF